MSGRSWPARDSRRVACRLRAVAPSLELRRDLAVASAEPGRASDDVAVPGGRSRESSSPLADARGCAFAFLVTMVQSDGRGSEPASGGTTNRAASNSGGEDRRQRQRAIESLLAGERTQRRWIIGGEHGLQPGLDARPREIVHRQEKLVKASALRPVAPRRVVAPIRQDDHAADVVDEAAERPEVGRPARLPPAEAEGRRRGAGGRAERGEEGARHERRHHHERRRGRAEPMPEQQAGAEADHRPQQVVLREPHQEARVLAIEGRLRRTRPGAREGVE